MFFLTKVNKNDQKMKIFVYKIDNFHQKMAKIVYFSVKETKKQFRPPVMFVYFDGA